MKNKKLVTMIVAIVTAIIGAVSQFYGVDLTGVL